jgi:hypothetical protein
MPSDRWYGLLHQLDTYVRDSNGRGTADYLAIRGNDSLGLKIRSPADHVDRIAARILVLASAFLVNEAVALNSVEYLPGGRASRREAVEAQRAAVALAHGVADALLSGVGQGRWRWIASLHSADGIAAMLLTAPRLEPTDDGDASDEPSEVEVVEAPGPATTSNASGDLVSDIARTTVLDGALAESEPSIMESLLQAAVAGEPHARERLLAEIHPLVLRYCRARLGRQETVMGSADDIALHVARPVVPRVRVRDRCAQGHRRVPGDRPQPVRARGGHP